MVIMKRCYNAAGTAASASAAHAESEAADSIASLVITKSTAMHHKARQIDKRVYP